MTTRYDDLTFPEVAELPRDVLLVLPIGTAHADTLPDDAVLLPALPYGWPGSLIAFPRDMFALIIERIFGTLREDGFFRFALLAAPHQPVADVGWPVLPATAAPEYLLQPAQMGTDGHPQTLLVVTGHTEQHGYHLPLSTDTVIISAIAEGTARALPHDLVVLPAWPYGVSMHRRQFPGTMNLGGRLFEDMMVHIVGQGVALGYRSAYIINGHGGNSSFQVNAVKYAGELYPDSFIATTWLHTTDTDSLARLRESAIGGMGHACELETAYLLHLRPDLCKMERCVDEITYISTPNYYMDWIEGGLLVANPPWTDDTLTGSYGAGSLGTAEKGAAWLESAVAQKVAHVREIREQYARRHAVRHSQRVIPPHVRP